MASWQSFLKKRKEKHKPAVEWAGPVLYHCDVCFAEIKNGDHRYHCVECVSSYDLCYKCHKKGRDKEHAEVHGEDHTFIIERRSEVATCKLVRSEVTLEGTIRNMFHYFVQRPSLGCYNASTNSYHYHTYGEVGELVRCFASGVQWLTEGGKRKGVGRAKKKGDGGILKGKVASIYGPTCLEWYLADFAFLMMGVVNAPITVTADRGTVEHILRHAEVEVVVCAPSVLGLLLSLISSGDGCSLSTIVVMDQVGQETPPIPSTGPAAVVMFSEVLRLGKQHLISAAQWKQIRHDPNEMFTIAFTSGSTGQPKGCIFSRSTWNMRISSGHSMGSLRVWLSYHPPSHNLERGSVYNTLCSGGKVGFYRGSMEHLLDDYALVRPTVVASTPRFWNMLYNKYLQALQIAYREYLSLPSEERKEEKDEEVQEKGSQEVVRGDEGIERGEEAEMKTGRGEQKESTYLGREEVEKEEDEEVVEVEDKGKGKECDKDELEGMVKEKKMERHSGLDGGDEGGGVGITDNEDRQQHGFISEEEGRSSEAQEGQRAHLRPQLSHLSSFDGEVDESLDEDLLPLHLDSSGSTTEQQALVTEGGKSPAVTASSGDESETAFDSSAVPYRVTEKVMKQFKSILGGREYFVVTGGAPTSEVVKKFISQCFGGLPSEGYGATEVGGIAHDGRVLPRSEIKLLDVPEMGYLTTDQPPRGELCVKTPAMISGYFKNDQETRERFIDGYFRTGDIVVLEQPDKVRIIDRKKNLFKLAQGEFVSPEQLENLYTSSSPLISQIYIYGNSLQTNIVAVVVPQCDSLMGWWKESYRDTEAAALTYEEVCNRSEVREHYMKELSTIAKSHGLQGWEVPGGLLLEAVPFSLENGLLTAVQKKSRPKLELKYRSRLEELYSAINAHQSKRPLEVCIMEYFQHHLQQLSACSSSDQCSEVAEYASSTITQLGGDSLTAMRLSGLLKEHLSIDISAQTILSQPLGRVLEMITPQAYGSGHEGMIQRTSEVSAIDWDEEVSLGFLEDYCQRDGGRSTAGQATVTVLLTGATGFLGRFTLLALLQNTRVDKVYCIVQRKHDTSPQDRMLQILSQLCSELSVEESFDHKLEVMEGNLTRPRLGLTEENHSTVCSHVDVIIHNGAVVNAALPYASLKQSNVESTKEVLKIACEGRPKYLHYVSTIGVFAPQHTAEVITEDTPPHKDRLNRLSGYSQSKWVAETLVLRAIDKGLFQGSVSRPGLIGPHSSTGHANTQDWVCWLVRGLAKMGCYPVGIGCDNKVIYCVPVEQVAQALVFFSLSYQGSEHIFHLVNNSTPFRFTALAETIKTCLYPNMTTCDYSQFHSRLQSAAQQSGDPVLSSLDLLLPRFGGWGSSHAYHNRQTVLACRGSGILMNYLPDHYLEQYIRYLCRTFGKDFS